MSNETKKTAKLLNDFLATPLASSLAKLINCYSGGHVKYSFCDENNVIKTVTCPLAKAIICKKVVQIVFGPPLIAEGFFPNEATTLKKVVVKRIQDLKYSHNIEDPFCPIFFST